MTGYRTLLVILISAGALAFGGVYDWAYWPLAAGAAALGVWGLFATRAWTERDVRIGAVCLVALGVAMSLQAVPLPRALFLRLNPAANAVLESSDVQYLINPPAAHALAILPNSTLTVLGVFVALGLFFLGLLHALPRIRIEKLIISLMVFGVGLAVFAIAQRATNVLSPEERWQLVYGFWKPKRPGNVFGPFINRNHFAGWMVMILSLALAYSCAVIETSGPSQRHDWRRWLTWLTRPEASKFMTVAVAVLAMGGALVVSGSRSGMAAFAAACAVVAYFAAVRVGRRRLRIAAIGYLFLLVVGAIGFAGVTTAAKRFALVSADAPHRFGAWRDTLHIIRDFPFFGTGVGGYGRAMLVYQTGDRVTFYMQAHNDYLQAIAEGGVLVGVPFFVCLIALVRGIRARLRRGEDNATVYWIRAGAIAGLSAIAAQSLVEFSLQLYGNTLLFALLAAVALHRPLPPSLHARRV